MPAVIFAEAALDFWQSGFEILRGLAVIAAQIAELSGGCEGCSVVGVAGFWSALEEGEGFFDLARCFVETLQSDEREREVGIGCRDLGVHAGK